MFRFQCLKYVTGHQKHLTDFLSVSCLSSEFTFRYVHCMMLRLCSLGSEVNHTTTDGLPVTESVLSWRPDSKLP